MNATPASQYSVPQRSSNPSLTSQDADKFYSLIVSCLSDGEGRKKAEEVLQQLEKRPGFFALLYQVISSANPPVNVRLMASIIFKNSVMKYWRVSAPFAVSNDEKSFLKSRILSTINEQSPQVHLQLSLAIGHMARWDFPEQWGDLFSKLIEAMQNGTEMQRYNILIIIDHVVDELASKIAGKELFEKVSMKLIDFMFNVWSNYIGQVLKLIGNSLEDNSATLTHQLISNSRNTLLCNKIIRKLIYFGMPNFDQNKSAFSFMEQMVIYLQKLFDYRCQCTQRKIVPSSLEHVEKCITSFMKSTVLVQSRQSLPFRLLLPNYLHFCYRVITMEQIDPKSEETLSLFITRCLIFMKNVLECPLYRNSTTGKLKEQRLEAEKIVFQQFFDNNTLGKLCVSLITKYLKLSDEDLECWTDDPETFIKETDNETGDCLLSSAENLFITLLDSFEERLRPPILQFLEKTLKETAGSFDRDKILLRDAIYCAMGNACYSLYESFDINQFYCNVLKKELEIKDPRYNIIRRRAAWVLGRWVEKLSESIIYDVYKSVISLLFDPDMTLKLTALNTLDAFTFHYEFDPNNFKDFVDVTMKQLFQILTIAKEEETKLNILHLISTLLEKLGKELLLPYVNTISQSLPALWKKSEKENMLRASIVSTTTCLVKVLGEHSIKIYSFVIPLIQYGTDPEKPDRDYIIEQSLELWSATLQNANACNASPTLSNTISHPPLPQPVITSSPSSTNDLLQIFKNAVKLIQFDFNYINEVLKITDHYVLLEQSRFLNSNGQNLTVLFELVIGKTKEKPLIVCCEVLESLLLLFPREAPRAFHTTFQKLLVAVMTDAEPAIVLSCYISLLSRILLSDKDLFFEFLKKMEYKDALGTYLEVLIQKFDYIYTSSQRKSTALSLLNLLPSNNESVMKRIGDILNICLQVLFEFKELKIAEHDKLISNTEDEETSFDIGSKNEIMKRKLQLKMDPCIKLNMKDILIQKMNQMSKLLGAQQFQAYLKQNVDPTILQQLQRELNG